MTVWFAKAVVMPSSDEVLLKCNAASIDAFIPAESARQARDLFIKEVLATGFRVISIDLLYDWTKSQANYSSSEIKMSASAKQLLDQLDRIAEERATKAARTEVICLGTLEKLPLPNASREALVTTGLMEAYYIADQEAEQRKHNTIDPEHLLLATIKQGGGLAVPVLKRLAVNVELLANDVTISLYSKRGVNQKEGSPHLGASGEQVFSTSREIARQIQCGWCGTGHLLLALIKLDQFVPGQLFRQMHVEYENALMVLQEAIAKGESLDC